MVFHGKEDAALVVWQRVKTFSNDFRIFNLVDPHAIPPIQVSKSWMKPPKGYVKINFDTAVSNSSVGYEAIARDSDGFILGCCYRFVDKLLDANWAEMEALVESLKLVSTLKVSKIIFEFDSTNLVNRANKRDQDMTLLGCCVKKACMAFNNFDLVQIKWINRSSNNTTYLLCNFAIKKRCNLSFKMDYPLEIYNIVIQDATFYQKKIKLKRKKSCLFKDRY